MLFFCYNQFSSFFFFFFFQAEDVIRDHCVTGVQTCALPISQLDALVELHGQPHAAGFRWAEERAKEYRGGEQAAVFEALELWQSWWRDVLLAAAGCPEQIAHLDRSEQITQAARRYHLADIHAFITRLDATA